MFAYLIDVKWRLHEALDIGKGRGRVQAFNRVMKLALQDAALYWHKTFIRGHFDRQAYDKYKGDYPRRKKRNRSPFVHTGALKARMTYRKGPQHLSGTANRITLKMPIGRPKGNSKKSLDAQVAILIRAGMSAADAKRQVYNVGYGAKNKAAFQQGIAATTTKEEQQVAEHMAKWIVDDINSGGLNRKPAKQRRKRIKG